MLVVNRTMRPKLFLKSHSYYFLGHCEFIPKRCNKIFAKIASKFKSVKLNSNVALFGSFWPHCRDTKGQKEGRTTRLAVLLAQGQAFEGRPGWHFMNGDRKKRKKAKNYFPACF